MVSSGDFFGRVFCHWPRKKGARALFLETNKKGTRGTPPALKTKVVISKGAFSCNEFQKGACNATGPDRVNAKGVDFVNLSVHSGMGTERNAKSGAGARVSVPRNPEGASDVYSKPVT